MACWFDAHLHLSDPRLHPVVPRVRQIWRDAQIVGGLTCAAFPAEWGTPLPDDPAIIRAYGIHPWAAAEATEVQLAELETLLRAQPHALVGEIGLDGLRKTANHGAQQTQMLLAQLALAERLSRPVILHGARKWSVLFDTLLPWAARLPALLLHGAAFSVEQLRHPLFQHHNLWFSFGTALLNPTAQKLRQLATAVPADRLLIETDAPDMLPRSGDYEVLNTPSHTLNHPANLCRVGTALAALRGCTTAEIAAQTTQNAHNFCAQR
jgi:TatD DNase family protein